MEPKLKLLPTLTEILDGLFDAFGTDDIKLLTGLFTHYQYLVGKRYTGKGS